MKKYFALVISTFLSIHLSAQNAQALVAAEKAFEKSCLESGIRNGFLANVDSNGIDFSEKGPVDAKQFWRSIPAFDGIFSLVAHLFGIIPLRRLGIYYGKL
jgi:hypothetical protein